MRVEKLEMIGFKSFGDRTVFKLHPGITCIVGPNGCGKSNVVDSFKWVLGEQSAKSLRGGKMEEVIFAGSQNKKPRGMAETSLHIAGLGSAGNGDSMTTVTRRLYRSGDSEYLLNRNSCRLRDIKDIFLDTGLDVKSYSVMEQDRIAAILSAKPDERRFIIEEVAGVVKYKVRRNEAQSKLESSRNNLQRINDIVSEVKRQINSLDRQVKKAERYKRFMEELRVIELKVAKRDFTELSGKLEEILRQYESMKEEIALQRAELSENETDIEKRRIETVEKEKALDALKQSLQSVEREMAEAERQAAVSKTEMNNLREYVGKLSAQERESLDKREEALNRKQQIEELRTGLQAEIENLQSGIQKRNETLRVMEQDISGKEQLLDAKRRETFRASEDLGTLKNELNRFSATLENLLGNESSLRNETEELGTTLGELNSQLGDVESTMLDKNNEMLSIKEEKTALDTEVKELRERLETFRTDRARAREELASSMSRLESLNEMVFSESSEEALKEHVALIATVSDIIEVSPEYEHAVESALREIINGFVVQGYNDVRQAAKALKEKGMGRTAFIPVDVDGRHNDSSLPPGAIAWASQLVTSKDEFSRIIRNILGSVVVVQDLEAALALRESPFTIVTLGGEIMEPSGVVTAGKSRGILPLKRQIRELSSEVDGRKTRIKSLDHDIEQTSGAIAAKEAGLSDVISREVNIEKELSLLRHRAEKHNEEIDRANRKLSMLRIEMETLLNEKESLQNQIASKEGEILLSEQGRQLTEETVAGIVEELANKKSEYEDSRARSVDIQLSLNTLTERLNAMKSEEASIGALVREMDEKRVFIANETTETERRIKEREEDARAKEETIRGLAVQASEKSSIIAAQREVIDAESEELLGKERALKSLRSRIDDLAQELSEVDVSRAEHSLKIENLKEKIRSTHDVELETLEAEPVAPEDEERLSEVKRKIENLGPVSLGSIEEYEELRERYDFLTKQQEDLHQSIAELEEAIKRINATTRKRLREAYDALKVKFSEVFTTLFGGGRAELVLTDESNILETGIDIIAQPPGKRFQNISLLSGGEKTLTALALLFASFLIKPTPLCILDEADAALDESNTYKFAQMLRDLSKEIQFIVVTHNRVTMEAADYIYGVTMEEPGNSKVISMQMAEAVSL